MAYVRLAPRPWRFWLVWSVIGALVPLLVSCGHTAANGAGRAGTVATPAPSATPLPPLKLDWRAGMAPPGSNPAAEPPEYFVAPSDARVTWACAFTGDGARVWVTRDGGATWSHGVDLPYAGRLSECVLVVDANNPLRAIAWLNTAKMGASPDPGNVVTFLSVDGGGAWRTVPKAGPAVAVSFTSSAGALYAGGNGLDASGNGIQDLWASHDGGASWRALHAVHLTPNVRIWANPETGELVGFNDFDSTLWRSGDGGATWMRLPAAPLASGENLTYLVASHLSGWLICANATYSSGVNTLDRATCSADLGATWAGAPADTHAQLSPKGFVFTVSGSLLAIADNGALLDVYVGVSGERVEELAPGASAWAAVNPPTNVSEGGVGYVYCSGPGDGALWVMTDDNTHPFSIARYP